MDKDSLKYIRSRLINLDKDAPEKIEKKVKREVKNAFHFARKSKFPNQKMHMKVFMPKNKLLKFNEAINVL